MLTLNASRSRSVCRLGLLRCLSTSAKPKVLLLDPVNLAKEDLAALEDKALLIVSARRTS